MTSFKPRGLRLYWPSFAGEGGADFEKATTDIIASMARPVNFMVFIKSFLTVASAARGKRHRMDHKDRVVIQGAGVGGVKDKDDASDGERATTGGRC
jgi:hypothetical protein